MIYAKSAKISLNELGSVSEVIKKMEDEVSAENPLLAIAFYKPEMGFEGTDCEDNLITIVLKYRLFDYDK